MATTSTKNVKSPLSPGAAELIAGAGSRHKRLLISGVAPEVVAEALRAPDTDRITAILPNQIWEAVFREHGGNTEFLERMSSVLLAIHQGIAGVQPFVAALLEHELLESFVLDVQLANGSQNRLAGFYAINEERLLGLNGAVLERFNRAGYLQAIHMAIASLSQFRALIERMNKLNAGEL